VVDSLIVHKFKLIVARGKKLGALMRGVIKLFIEKKQEVLFLVSAEMVLHNLII
jgi:hypothetical protein